MLYCFKSCKTAQHFLYNLTAACRVQDSSTLLAIDFLRHCCYIGFLHPCNLSTSHQLIGWQLFSVLITFMPFVLFLINIAIYIITLNLWSSPQCNAQLLFFDYFFMTYDVANKTIPSLYNIFPCTLFFSLIVTSVKFSTHP